MSNAVALVFPGQGSQSMGMLSELAADFPQVRDCFAEASEGAGVDLWALSQEGPEAQLNQTEFTQPALLAAGVAVWWVWQASNGSAALALAGHSLGEYAALVAAGALSLADGAALVRERGRLMQQAVPAGVGSMAAVLGAAGSDRDRWSCGGGGGGNRRTGRAGRAQSGETGGQRAFAYAVDARRGRTSCDGHRQQVVGGTDDSRRAKRRCARGSGSRCHSSGLGAPVIPAGAVDALRASTGWLGRDASG